MSRDEIIAANPIVEFVRGRGYELKQAGQNFVTNACPVAPHKRGHRPVTIDPAKQLWHCNDCEVGGSVIDWLAREKEISGADAIRELAGGRNDQKPRPKFVCAYNYTDESGKLLFQVCRFNPKDFRQRRPDGGHWIWDLQGVRRVLYRLPEVIAAQTVIVVEGEKDADNVRALGFTATTNCGGAEKWKPEYSETLRDKDVIVIGHNDTKGHEHVAQVIQSLTGIARSIKDVILPDTFKDVSDYIASMLPKVAARAIAKLIEAAPEIAALNSVDVDAEDSPEIEPHVPYRPPSLDLLPSQLQDYICAAAESLDVDPAFVFLPHLSALGTAIGNARSIYLKRSFVQPPVIWTSIIAPTGSGKSPAVEAGTLPLRIHEQQLQCQNREAYEIYENEMGEWEAKRRRGSRPKAPAQITCWLDDATLEAVAMKLHEHARGVCLVKDELSHWFASFDQYRNSRGADVSRWVSLHTATLFALDRLTDRRSYRIWNPRLCIASGVQPKILQRILTPDYFERGLPARFLFAYPPTWRRKWSERAVPHKVEAAMLDLFDALWNLQPERDKDGNSVPVLLELDEQAKAIYVAFYNECGEAAIQSGENEAAQWAKLSGYAARLALNGQLARNPAALIVTGEVMIAACNLARWFGNEAMRIYALLAETTEQREQRRLIEFIQSRGSSATVRDVMQGYRPLRNQREEIEFRFRQLEKDGRGKWKEIRPAGRGRPTRAFQLLNVSTSTQFPQPRGETPNSVDVDALCVSENTH